MRRYLKIDHYWVLKGLRHTSKKNTGDCICIDKTKYSSYNLLLFLKSLPRGGVAGEAQAHVIQICTEIY